MGVAKSLRSVVLERESKMSEIENECNKLAGGIIAILLIVFLIWLWGAVSRFTKSTFDEEAKRVLMGPEQRKWYDTVKEAEIELRDKEWARKRLQR